MVPPGLCLVFVLNKMLLYCSAPIDLVVRANNVGTPVNSNVFRRKVVLFAAAEFRT